MRWSRTSPSECLFQLIEIVILAYLNYKLLDGLSYWYSHLGDYQFVFRPASIMLFMPSCMASAAVVLLLDDRVKSYVFGTRLGRTIPDGWTSTQLSGSLRKLAITCALIFEALGFALVPAHTRISGSGIAVHPIWPLSGQTYSYSDVSCISLQYYYMPPSRTRWSGEWSRERALSLAFRDGSTWTTRNGLVEANTTQRSEAADYISDCTGVPVQTPPAGSPQYCSIP